MLLWNSTFALSVPQARCSVSKSRQTTVHTLSHHPPCWYTWTCASVACILHTSLALVHILSSNPALITPPIPHPHGYMWLTLLPAPATAHQVMLVSGTVCVAPSPFHMLLSGPCIPIRCLPTEMVQWPFSKLTWHPQWQWRVSGRMRISSTACVKTGHCPRTVLASENTRSRNN